MLSSPSFDLITVVENCLGIVCACVPPITGLVRKLCGWQSSSNSIRNLTKSESNSERSPPNINFSPILYPERGRKGRPLSKIITTDLENLPPASEAWPFSPEDESSLSPPELSPRRGRGIKKQVSFSELPQLGILPSTSSINQSPISSSRGPSRGPSRATVRSSSRGPSRATISEDDEDEENCAERDRRMRESLSIMSLAGVQSRDRRHRQSSVVSN
jgi:hypothetical protein